MAKTKDEILKAYNKLKNELNKQPSYNEFYNLSKVTEHDIKMAFGSNGFNKLVEDVGDKPNKFSTEKTDLNDILSNFGKLARSLNKIPNSIDWTFHKMTPAPNNISKYHKLKWPELITAFYLSAKDEPEWSDILHLFDSVEKSNSEPVKQNISSISPINDYQSEYIPPIVENLVKLSFSEEKAKEFEDKVNIAFEIMGFEVQKFGQGTGRNPDGIAIDRENNYAILIDAKSRGDSYKIGTEDRKFIEYIETHRPLLKKAGIKKFYFLVVSSKLDKVSEKSLENILESTQVPLSLMTSKQLLVMLAHKIKSPRSFDLKKIQKLFLKGGLAQDFQIGK